MSALLSLDQVAAIQRLALESKDFRLVEGLMAEAAHRFVIADLDLEESLSRCDPGVVIAAMAAKHDMRLLAGIACGCDEGSCEGLIG